jgi:hypothetical protein
MDKMRLARERKGQFIIIAAMLLSIMIVSVSTVIYGTVTYYRQERWEEYVTIVDSIKTASCNLLQVGLANYAQTSNSTVLRDYFNQWIRDVRNAYPGFGIDVGYALANGVHSAYGVSLNYNLGLNRTWNKPTSYVASNATVSVNVASVGLTGYNFSSHVFLKMSIRDAVWYSKSSKRYVILYLSVDKDGPEPVVNLQASNFPTVKLSGVSQSYTVKRYYSSVYSYFIYEIKMSSIDSLPSSANVTLVDNRGIRTISYTSTVTQVSD